jgi:hypothetical protein
VNEAIIDFALDFAEFERIEPVVPLLGCRTCNRDTVEYIGIKISSHVSAKFIIAKAEYPDGVMDYPDYSCYLG